MTKNPPKRTFRKKNKMYIPQTLYCPYCGGKAILRPVSYLFGDEVNPGSSEHYYVCTNYPECDAYIACYHGNFAPKGRLADASITMSARTIRSAMRILPAITATLPPKADWLMHGCVTAEMLHTATSS